MIDAENTEVILIVDDSPTNLEVLSDTLIHGGFEVAVATDGEGAIEQIGYEAPDLILLDILMPGIDGFETCRRLKANSSTQDIPIIFMTALSDLANKVRGFHLGAVDYITKPFQQEEVLARVRLHLKLYHLTQALEQKNTRLLEEIEQRSAAEAALQQLTENLEQRIQERTAELTRALDNWQQAQTHLVESEKLYSLGQMVAGIAHEINGPVGFIHCNLPYASDYIQDMLQLLDLYNQYYPYPQPEIQQKIEEIDLEFLRSDLPKLLESMQMGSERICQVITSLRSFSRLDRVAQMEMKTLDLHQGLENTLRILQHRFKATPQRPTIEIIREYGNLPPIECYPGQLNQVFMNLLTNAIDALEESVSQDPNSSESLPPDSTNTKLQTQTNQLYSYNSATTSLTSAGVLTPTEFEQWDCPTLKICTQARDDNWVTISIRDNGAGIPPLVQAQIFDPFFTTKPIGKGTGLGLSISYQIIVERHGGKLSCYSTPNVGTEFLIELPIHSATSSQS